MYEPTLIEKQIDELNGQLVALQDKGRFRRVLAYALKIVAGGSALVIAIDFVHGWDRGLAAAALIAIFVDTVFSNHEQLIGEASAGHTARAIRKRIANDYNGSLQPILDLLNSSPRESEAYAAATTEKNALQSETHKRLLKAVEEIDAALAELDLKALALSLEAEKGKIEKK